MKEHTVFRIMEESQVWSFRKSVGELAESIGMNEADTGKAMLVAAEMGSNIAKYASGGGETLVNCVTQNGGKTIELISLDNGPGMIDPDHMLTDGATTQEGSLGGGLGAMKRLSSVFDIYSSPDKGTAILSRVKEKAIRNDGSNRGEPIAIAGLSIPMPGEMVCGDTWGYYFMDGVLRIMVADGMGHGPHAAHASEKALEVFLESGDLAPGEIIKKADEELRSTRGATMAVAYIMPEEGLLIYAGVGNITGFVIDGERKIGCFSHDGTVGYSVGRIDEMTYRWRDESLLVMFSDGVKRDFDLNDYRNIDLRHPALISAIIYRDFNRGMDDACVIVAKKREGETL